MGKTKQSDTLASYRKSSVKTVSLRAILKILPVGFRLLLLVHAKDPPSRTPSKLVGFVQMVSQNLKRQETGTYVKIQFTPFKRRTNISDCPNAPMTAHQNAPRVPNNCA